MNDLIEKSFVILSLDPRGVILDGKDEVLSRQNNYGEHLKKISNDYQFIIFSSSRDRLSQNSREFVKVFSLCKPTFNSLRFAWMARKLISQFKLDVKLLIVGDCWESYWCAYFLNRMLKQRAPIQIQLHGDIANPLWRGINYKNRLRYIFAKTPISRANSVRTVSKYQSNLLVKTYGVDRKIIVIIPVPINSLGRVVSSGTKRVKTIGFIGRIHKDRGIWEFVEFVKKLNSQNKSFKIVIAGSGPEKNEFIKQLHVDVAKSRISYLGQLPQEKLAKLWKQIGVLVSMAPVESYGRVMREALVAGVPVWATESSGVKDLMDRCEKGTVKILDANKSTSALNQDFELLLKTKVSPKFAKEFIKENNTYAAKLAQSWVKVISQSKQS
jgi:glycosyltransferase involved in cell wall biosynthesis